MWAVALVGGLITLAVVVVGTVFLVMLGTAALARLLMGSEVEDDQP